LKRIRTGYRPATNIYCGSSWTPVVGLSKCLDINVWIVSAGYGLIHHSDSIVSYAATFSRLHPDSVSVETLFSTSDWWNQSCKYNITGRSVKTISDVVKEDRTVPIIVALSKNYLDAVYKDLCNARSNLESSNLLSIVSVGSTKDGELLKNFLPCDTRMEKVIGWGRSSLNTRILSELVKKCDVFDFESLCSSIDRLQENQTPATYPVRERLTDAEVLDFITTNLRGTQSFTSILKRLRDSGRACEYQRFKSLYNRATSK